MEKEGIEVSFIHREPSRSDSPLPSESVAHWAGTTESLLRCVSAQRAEWLWVQLSSYGYSRWGAPLQLSRTLRALQRRMPKVLIAVCAHETHCQPHQLGYKGWFLSPWQR